MTVFHPVVYQRGNWKLEGFTFALIFRRDPQIVVSYIMSCILSR